MWVVLPTRVQQNTAELVLSFLPCAPYGLGTWAPAQRRHLWKLGRVGRLRGACLLLTEVSAAGRLEHRCPDPSGLVNPPTGLLERKSGRVRSLRAWLLTGSEEDGQSVGSEPCLPGGCTDRWWVWERAGNALGCSAHCSDHTLPSLWMVILFPFHYKIYVHCGKTQKRRNREEQVWPFTSKQPVIF